MTDHPRLPPRIRPDVKDLDFGQVTPRIVDRLYRTKTWARAVALISFLSIAAVVVFCGAAWFRFEEGALLAPLALILAGVLALAAVLPAISLYRFAQTVEQMTQWNRGPSVVSAFEHLGSFWRRAGRFFAASLLVALGGGFLMLSLAPSDPMLAVSLRVLRDAEKVTSEHDSPLVLKEARFGRNAPRWFPALSPPASPGRSLTFEEIDDACRVANASFLCLLNLPGEPVGGGSRQVITGDDATFAVRPLTFVPPEDSREILEVTLQETHGRPSSLRLGPRKGFPLMKMAYEETSAGRYVPERPYLAFSWRDSFCGEKGRFHVRELARGADGLPDRLVVDFEMECAVGPPILGRLSIARK